MIILKILSKRIDSWQKSLSKMSRKKLISISIIVFLLISSGTILIIYRFSINKNVEALEKANFSIDNFDIITASKDEITIQFRLNVTNYDASSGPKFVEGDDINIILLNNSLEIAEFNVPLESGDFEASQIITTDLPIDPNVDNELLDTLINNILSGVNFELDFKGKINFHIGVVFRDSLEFNNKILFIVNATSLGLEINDIQIPNINSTSAEAEIEISSPFTTSFKITGEIITFISRFDLGKIHIEFPLEIQSGTHKYVLDWELTNSPQQTISEILTRFNTTIILYTDLNLSINEFQINTSPTLELGFGDDLFSLNVKEISSFDINSDNASFTMGLDIDLMSNIPMTLNITSISLDITTITDNNVGILNWESQSTLSIEPHSTNTISNVSIVFQNLAASTIIELIITQAIKIPIAIIHIQFFEEEMDLIFSLDQIDL